MSARRRQGCPIMSAINSKMVTKLRITTPGHPSHHGMRAPGTLAKNVATAATHADGTHAIQMSAVPSTGITGKATHAASPTTVAIGAAGAASTFASTPYVGSDGCSNNRTG